jgi:hypothetical protein
MRGAFLVGSLSAAIALVPVRAVADAQQAAPAPPPAVPSAPAPESAAASPQPSTGCDERHESGMSLGLRIGFALPAGSVSTGDSLKSNLSNMVPIWLDAGYRFNPKLYAGAYFQWAPASVSDDVCSKDLSCSAYDIRLGANVLWHFKWIAGEGKWAGPFDPWVGVGTGYESAITHVSTATGAKSHESNRAFEFANLQLGADWVSDPFHVGAFFSLAIAEYVERGQTTPAGSRTFAIPDPALHFWFMFGVRGQYDL